MKSKPSKRVGFLAMPKAKALAARRKGGLARASQPGAMAAMGRIGAKKLHERYRLIPRKNRTP